MEELRCGLLVIGGGPGGYVCAIKAGQLGLDTIIVEKEKLGGTCLNVGCIPSKALIHAADEFHRMAEAARGQSVLGISASHAGIDFNRTIAWKDAIVSRLNDGVAGLLRKARVRTIQGHARFLDGKTVEVQSTEGDMLIRADNIVIATGSAPVELPFLPFGDRVISSTEALAMTDITGNLAVVGGGYIGLEIGTAFAKLGSKVTVVEAAERLLPHYDVKLTQPVASRLKELGVELMTSARARGFDEASGSLVVEAASGDLRHVAADRILVAVGRRPVTSGFGLEELRLAMEGSFIRIDSMCRTSMRGVFAIGDVTGEPMLAHRAMAQGEMVAEIVAGRKRQWDKYCMPAVCFTDPEIVSVGQSPDEARAGGLDVEVGLFPLKANGRAMSAEREDGFVRVVARSDNHVILGIQATGAGVSELSAYFALAIEMGARLQDVAATVHAHPTRGEAVQEAGMMALGHALHL